MSHYKWKIDIDFECCQLNRAEINGPKGTENKHDIQTIILWISVIYHKVPYNKMKPTIDFQGYQFRGQEHFPYVTLLNNLKVSYDEWKVLLDLKGYGSTYSV